MSIKVVSASTTSVKFTVDAGCAGDQVTSLEDADISFKTALGVNVTHTFIAADHNGIYELTGTGFVTGNKLDLNGIVSQTEATYESTGAVSVTVPTP